MFCSKCGTQLSDNSNFCNNCGTVLTNQAQAAGKNKDNDFGWKSFIGSYELVLIILILFFVVQNWSYRDTHHVLFNFLFWRFHSHILIYTLGVVVITLLIAFGIFGWNKLDEDDSIKAGTQKKNH